MSPLSFGFTITRATMNAHTRLLPNKQEPIAPTFGLSSWERVVLLHYVCREI